MTPDRQIPMFSYDEGDFNFTVKPYDETESSLDRILRRTWQRAEEAKLFRYTLNIRSCKTLRGKYRFLAQLNPDRALHRRKPQSITSMLQPFSPMGFNFTKLTPQETLFDVGNGDGNDVVAINASPLEQGHSLLLTERFKCLPQVVTEHSLRKAIELCLLSGSRYLRFAFNSLCAHASVNHLHWHLYCLKQEMPLEYIDTRSYVSGVRLLVDYPAKGFCLKLSSFQDIGDLVARAFLVANYLQACQVAHNVYITRARSRASSELYDDVRIYIWARKSSTGVKDTTAFIPAVCELFGHLSIRDEEIYDKLTENDVIEDLNDITEEYFSLLRDELKDILEK
ncbi:hypothetical protein DMN91_010646 [Ooceraea biroi]|uniref:GDP-D-glucose phosphorylase 1 n=2 Tax=Ooceraea biroi TaxID=2015173 RepID=A0A3L8D9J4_OOCBI|nr:GDP-D-glucose phosphorylase 1 isoform X1 [Ooceraea biroi]RLU16578.1 hypothetical protein DMN91_010646 [Ooceraea biroi]